MQVLVPEIVKNYCEDIKLSADIMYINNSVFLISLDRHIHYSSITIVENLKCNILEIFL